MAGQEKEVCMQITKEGIPALLAGARIADFFDILPPRKQGEEKPHQPTCVAPWQQGGAARRHNFIDGDACA
jgi:hypothetical protein